MADRRISGAMRWTANAGLGATVARIAPRLLTPAVFALLLLAPPAAAQLSPGPLFKGHAKLEGVENCTKCHEVGKRLSSAKCLACHGALAARVNAGRGLHARPGHTACGECHVDHQGQDTPLTWWGDKDQKGFDHKETGWRLEGKHMGLECGKCHKADSIRDLEALKGGAADPAHTYLGLRGDCQDCHRDPHKAQLGADCQKCHTPETWRTASAFDHSRARFVLAGKHEKVPCARCHPAAGEEVTGEGPAGEDATSERRVGDNATDLSVPSTPDSLGHRQWRGVKFASCGDCHADPHTGRLGAACVTCHTSQGWKDVVAGRFDHERTRYPLRGQHAEVKCNACHRPGSPTHGLLFAACTNCHSDPHGKQFAANPDADDCADCHTVDGYAPSTYSIVRHAKTDYPLTGSHLAVPCVGCHAHPAAGAPVSRIRFHYESTRCAGCHKDPHRGEVDAAMQKGGCETCHRVESWSAVTFDHAVTRLPLVGKHATARCSACHRPAGPDGAPGPTKLHGLAVDCAACHADSHRGQFHDVATGTTRCDRCHTAAGWKAERFDHIRDATFKLDGAHQKAACIQCHPRERAGDAQWTRFKPVRADCVACHPMKPAPGEASREPRQQRGS